MDFRRTQLDNGLEIIAECNGEMHTSALGFFVKTGARDESPELNGVSHFLEHMAFKGSATRSAEDVNRGFDSLGADHNAYTSKESTVYFAVVVPRYADAVLELLADLLRPALRPDDFETERNVILDEILKTADEPPFNADEICDAKHFDGHPLGKNVLGTDGSIRALSLDAMRDYHARRYGAKNVVLAAAGRVDFDGLVASARRLCAAWQPGETGRAIVHPPRERGFHVLHKADAMQQYVIQMAAGPSGAWPERYAADLLTIVLGHPTGSRLYWEFVDTGEADSAVLSYGEYEGAGVFYSFLRCGPEKAEKNLARMVELFRRAEREGITAAELEQARNKVKSRFVLASERAGHRLFDLGDTWIHHNEYRSVRDELAGLDAVTLDDIAQVLRDYPLTALTTVTIGPLEKVAAPN